MRLINQFIKFSLGRLEYKDSEELEDALHEFVNTGAGGDEGISLLEKIEKRITELLNDQEDPSRITQKPWDETAGVFELKWHDLVPEFDPSLRLDALRVGISEVVNALKYIRKTRHYTKMIVKPRDFGYEES